MNKIFKVIWSKSKQCYVVVSEMAKNKTGKKKIVVASILAALAMQVGVVEDVTAADRPTGTIEGGTKMYSNLTNGLAIGNESQSNSNQSIAIGYRAVANSQYADPAQPAVAIGAGAHATGRGGVSLGLIANSSVRGTAIGSATQATGFGAFAGGTYAQATNAGDVAIGGASSDQFNNYAVASGGYSVAIGTAAKADGGAGVSIGYKTNAKTSNSLAVGSESQATGEGAVAVGRKNTSTGPSSTVLGILSTANATSATAVGMETTAKGENSLAVGHKSSAAGRNGVAVGTNGTTAELGGVAVGQAAKSNKFNSVAMGMNVTADGDNSVALGGSASANSDGTIAIGSYGSTPTKATGNRALAIGSATTANGLESIAIGSRVNSTSQHSIAIGTRANASAVKSVAIGPDSRATVDGGVALGRDSVANVIGGVTNKGYNPNTNRTDIYSGLTGNVLTSTTGAVSIGNGTTVTRQLTGLAAGTKDTDAVNVAQLKSVNLAFSGNVNTGNVNIANSTLGLKGDNTYITTSANGQNLTISGKTQNINVTNGQASANAAGMADSKNVADAINKAISANAYHWKLAADNTSTAPEVINKSDTVTFGGDNNITVTRSGKKITTSLNKAITVDTVKANRSVTVSSGGNQITLDGSNGAVTGRNFTGDSFKAGNNVLSNTTLQMGLPSSAKNVIISGDGLTAKNGTRTVKFGTDGISAGGQQITNVSSGGNVGTNAANITDVKNAVAAVTLNLDTNSKTGSVKLSESPLKVIGANGIRTDLLGTNNGSLVVGLDKSTVNATTKGIGLTGDTGSTGLKYLKDGDATFKVVGDGNLVTTKASTIGVQVAVDTAKVKDLAVGAVTVSKANTTDNPITVTPTAGTNSKDYAIGIDTTKLANQTQLTYKANGANPNKVSLANGLNFTDGTFTKATVGTNGNVTISTATETITNDADGKAKVNSPTDGLATAKNVAKSINKAVDGLSQNLTVSDGATDGTVNLKNQKLTVSGTNGVTTTVNGQTVTVGLDAATKTKVDDASTAVARNISLGADSGTVSSQSLKDGDVAFNVKAATGDLVSTKMNGNTVEISTKRAAITSDANTGAASVTGDDGLATSKNVADAINKAADAAKASAAWNLTTNSSTTDKTTVQGGDTVDLINGDNILITQDGTDKKKITVATKKDLTVDSITAGNTVMNTSGLTNGTTAITGTGITTDKVTVGGISIDKTDGINGGNKTITNVASGGTTDTNAANIGDVKQAVANLSQNLNITDGTNNGTIDLKNQKLNVAGTNGVTATVNNQTITVGLDTDTKTKVDNSSNAVARNISLGADSGTPSSQSLKDGDVAFNVKGATGDFISTKMNGNTVEVSTKRATISSDAAGTASVTGDDGLATAKNVADAINKAANQAKDGAAWKLSANGDTPTTVAGGDTVDFTGDNNITVTQTGKNIATTLNKDLKDLSTISLTNPRGETISLDGSTGIIKAYRAEFKDNVGAGSSIDSDRLRFTNGETGANEAQTYIGLDTVSVQAGPNSSGLTSKYLMFSDEDGNNAEGSAQGMAFQNAAGKTVQFTIDEINAGGNKIKEVAEGTDDTDAVNVKQLKDTVASQTLTYRANTAADADAKTVKLSKGLDFVDGTMTKATVDNDGKVTFDINDDTKTKINDAAAAVSRKVSLGADSGTASSQSLKDGDVAFNVKGATGDFISTKMNG
ncbi:ESPR-type extended signal peptide-containing protein, partial [uncultured Veillonella sp.]|uniref:ESPR-type extended signal peptide-containing protein n=1 Tax=uncultured Veillonella sp. TaxID=159268 RepID=UPI002805F0AA